MTGDAVYKHLEPDPIVFDHHHVVPDSWWQHAHPGEPYPEAVWPLLTLSPSTHRLVHVALDAIVAEGGVEVPDRRRYGKAFAVAVQGYNLALASGLIPKPTLLAR